MFQNKFLQFFSILNVLLTRGPGSNHLSCCFNDFILFAKVVANRDYHFPNGKIKYLEICVSANKVYGRIS